VLGSGDGDVVRRGRRDLGQLVMGSSVIVRLGGLVAIVGGLAATILGLLYVLQAWGMTLDFTAKALQKGHYENPVATMLLIGLLAAIVALHLVQRWYYGRWGALTSAAAFTGIAMVVSGNLMGELAPATAAVDIVLLVLGALAATVGIVGLGIVTISVGVLPRWCGIAIIAGSPPGVGISFLFIAPLGMARILPGEVGWALAGIPWVVVGYAVFRAATPQARRPSRVK
jgi:hypothetical protein